MLESGGVTSALRTLNIDDDTISQVIAALTNAVDTVDPKAFHGSAKVRSSGFGDTTDALDLSTQYDLAYQVIHQFLLDTVTDLNNFAAGVTKAKSLFVDADTTSGEDLNDITAGLSDMTTAAHKWGA